MNYNELFFKDTLKSTKKYKFSKAILNHLEYPTLTIKNETFVFGMPYTEGTYIDWRYTYKHLIDEQIWVADRKKDTTKRKQAYPKLALINRVYALLCCDIDKLPDGFSSFDALNEHLRNEYPNAIVVNSVSGKSKLFFVVKHNGLLYNVEEVVIRRHIERMFNNPTLWDYVDKSWSSYTQTFVNSDMLSSIRHQLNLITPIDITAIIEEERREKEDVLIVDSFSNNTYVSPLPPILRYSRPLPRFINTEFIKGDTLKEEFIRILSYNTSALLNGYDISTVFIGKELDVDPKYISRFNKKLCDLGLLKLVSNSYIVGKKAKTYVASGQLRDWLNTINQNQTSPQTPKSLPTAIEDGQWDKVVFDTIVEHKGNEKKLNDWFYSLPGWDLKDREARFKHQLTSCKNHKTKVKT